MKTVRRRSVRIFRVACAVWVCTAATALAADETAKAVSGLDAPHLITFVSATFPDETNGEIPDEGEVRARLLIDETGHVISVRIEFSTHPAFEAPAEEAMRQFIFSPARVDGEPIVAEALYRYRFEARPAAETFESSEGAANEEVEEAEPPAANEAAADDYGYESTVRGRRIYEGVTELSLDAESIRRIPGIHGDAVLAIQTLPGVAKPPAMLGALFVRGSSDYDSVSLVDSLSVPTVFHFGAVNTVINSDLIDTVSFYPGNFSVRYGRGTGGVVDIHTRAPASDRLHAYLDADLWDATAFIEGPLSKRWSAAASFRRSYIDGVLKATHLRDEELQFTAAPRYYDFQVKATYRAKRGDTLSLMVFGSDDRVELGSDLLSETGYMSRELFTRTYFYTGGFTWFRRLNKNLENELSVRAGYWVRKGEGSYSASTVRSVPIDVRDELTVDVIPELRLRLGVDTEVGFHKTEVTERFVDFGVVGPESSIDGESSSEERFAERPAMYLQAELLALPKTELVYGIRADYDSLTGSWAADPRFEARCRPLPETLMKAGLGLFHQPPAVSFVAEVEDPNSLRSMAAIHYGFSVEQIVPRYKVLSFELGGFYKDLSRTSFNHKGLGRAMGMELLIRHRASRHFFGWLSYTLMKSERYMYDDVTAVPFGFDQRHVLSLVAGVSIGHGVDFGLRFRLASGLPYTPIIGERYYDDWFGSSYPVWGSDNSARMPLFHQLDLRVDKRFEWKSLSLSIYLDVQNVYNRQNTVVYLYSSDYSEKRTIYDLPVFPSIGLKVAY